jgi:hypothetical protein
LRDDEGRNVVNGTKAARQNLMAEMAIRGLDESVAQIEDKR